MKMGKKRIMTMTIVTMTPGYSTDSARKQGRLLLLVRSGGLRGSLRASTSGGIGQLIQEN
jgi:hypothetical protein